jgi:hypothetical protein
MRMLRYDPAQANAFTVLRVRDRNYPAAVLIPERNVVKHIPKRDNAELFQRITPLLAYSCHFNGFRT